MPSEDEKQAIGQALIDLIIERTENNEDIDGNRFDRYSPDYIKSTNFKAYDKSASDINMTMTGDMMSDLDILETTRNGLVLGFNDDMNEQKAANHNKGVTVPRRQFFGVKEKDIQAIVDQFAEIPPVEDGESFQDALDFLNTRTGEDAIKSMIGDLLEVEYGED